MQKKSGIDRGFLNKFYRVNVKKEGFLYGRKTYKNHGSNQRYAVEFL